MNEEITMVDESEEETKLTYESWSEFLKSLGIAVPSQKWFEENKGTL